MDKYLYKEWTQFNLFSVSNRYIKIPLYLFCEIRTDFCTTVKQFSDQNKALLTNNCTKSKYRVGQNEVPS